MPINSIYTNIVDNVGFLSLINTGHWLTFALFKVRKRRDRWKIGYSRQRSSAIAADSLPPRSVFHRGGGRRARSRRFLEHYWLVRIQDATRCPGFSLSPRFKRD